MLSDRSTYEKFTKPAFDKIESELNSQFLQSKQSNERDKNTYKKLHSTNDIPPAIPRSVKHHKPSNRNIIIICNNMQNTRHITFSKKFGTFTKQQRSFSYQLYWLSDKSFPILTLTTTKLYLYLMLLCIYCYSCTQKMWTHSEQRTNKTIS